RQGERRADGYPGGPARLSAARWRVDGYAGGVGAARALAGGRCAGARQGAVGLGLPPHLWPSPAAPPNDRRQRATLSTGEEIGVGGTAQYYEDARAGELSSAVDRTEYRAQRAHGQGVAVDGDLQRGSHQAPVAHGCHGESPGAVCDGL